MPNQSLVDLTERTATADSDLVHVNSGGTDYKQTKANFLADYVSEIEFNNTSALTTQVDALPVGSYGGAYTGKIASYGHQSETGVPENDNYTVEVSAFSTQNKRITIMSVLGDKTYTRTKLNGTWGSWILVPRRDEITSLNNSLTNITEFHYTDEIKANGWASNGISVYGKIGNLGFIQASMRNGTINSNLMTLPSGFRPSGSVVVSIVSPSGANGYAVINTNGTVIPSAMTTQAAIFTAIYPLA